MAFMSSLMGIGLLFYLLLGSRQVVRTTIISIEIVGFQGLGFIRPEEFLVAASSQAC